MLSLTGIDFHPDNKRFLTSSEDGKVRLWSRQPQDNIINLESDPFVNEVSVSPDNSMALIVGRDGKRIDLWDTQKASGIHPLEFTKKPLITCFFSMWREYYGR